MPRLTNLSAPIADSPVIDSSVTVVIINSAADNFWPNISGEIHLDLLLIHFVFVKEQLRWFVSFLYTGQLFQSHVILRMIVLAVPLNRSA